ncbi:MAG TPA: rhodanese-like domain-containing protein [Thermoplasmata archaeon]|nr:rhodanese-like domain-containing protein [Thermoplasmata archaeon]
MVAPVSPTALAARLKEHPQDLVLLDVREPMERDLAKIEPSLFIPMDQVPYRLEEIPKGVELVVYCHSGTRSAMVAGFLEGQGYQRVGNLMGGIDAWSRRVDPSVPRYS